MQFADLRTLPVVLASASPRRREILERLGFRCEITPTNLDEEAIRHSDAAEQTRRIAREKARVGAKANKLTIAADTVVVVGSEVLEKPRDANHARTMLQRLSGREHCVYTAVALIFPHGETHEFLEETRVHFRVIAPDVIEEYILSAAPYDKAGGYGVQDAFGIAHIARIEGCFYNIMGFPASRFMAELACHQKFLL